MPPFPAATQAISVGVFRRRETDQYALRENLLLAIVIKTPEMKVVGPAPIDA
jgi:hypothetical protein